MGLAPVTDQWGTYDMEIITSDNIRERVIKALASEFPDKSGAKESGRPMALPALDYLRSVNPVLVQDNEVRNMVIEALSCCALGYRWYAALALHAIGDPLGIVHLTYNSLSIHPITGQHQPSSSGWGDGYLIQHALSMTDECIELLIQDILNPPGYLHADVLSMLPPERIVNRVLSLLDQPLRIAAQAAYVLAMKGRSEGRAVLEQIAETMNLRYIELAIIGLSHIPNQRTVELIRGFTDQNHPIYGKSDYEFGVNWLSKKELLTKSMQRLLMLEPGTGAPFIEVMKHFYMLPPAREWKVGMGITIPVNLVAPTLFEITLHSVTWTPDFIAEFATESERNELAEIQTKGMLEFLEAVPMDNLRPLSWPRFMSWAKRPMDSRNFFGENILGIQVVNDKEDYLFSATDWLLNPQDYRLGSHRWFSIGLES